MRDSIAAGVTSALVTFRLLYPRAPSFWALLHFVLARALLLLESLGGHP